MIKKLLNLILFSGIAIIAWFLNINYQNADLSKIFQSFTSIAVIYLVLKVFLEGAISKRITDSRARYSFRKTTQILFILVASIVVLRIWVPNPQDLLVAYGLFAAGVAISLQDIFKNFAGAITILLSNVYKVGDRIEIDSRLGDVIDIGLFYTTVLEIGEWVNGDQTTGRIMMIPNGQVLFASIKNYTKDHNFIWDEISLPITYGSDWQKAITLIEEIIKKETEEASKSAEAQINKLQERYFLSKRNIEPKIFVTPTDNWIMLRARYVSEVRDRRSVNSELSKIILESISQVEDITIASQTLAMAIHSEDSEKNN